MGAAEDPLGDERLDRAVGDYVRSLDVPDGLVEGGWRVPRRGAARLAADGGERRGRGRRLAGPLLAGGALLAFAAVVALSGRLAPPKQPAATPVVLTSPGASASAAGTPASCPAALLEGTLVRGADLGPAVRTADGTKYRLVLPPNDAVRDEAGTLVLLDASGAAIAREGDQVSVGGGETGTDGWNACGGIAVIEASPTAVAPSPSPSAAAAPDLAVYPWYTMQFFSGCPANVPPEPLWQCSGGGPARDGFLELYAGTLDGRTPVHVVKSLPVSAQLWVGRGSEASASGPFGAKVLYWFYDGRGSELHTVDAVTGANKRLLRINDIVYNAVLDPTSSTVYFGELDATTRHDLGVWRLTVGSDAAPERLVAPQAHHDTGSQQWRRLLYLTPDETRLVVVDCQDQACSASVRRAADGLQIASASGLSGSGNAAGVTDADLLAVACDPDCSVRAMGLATGEVRAVTSDPCVGSGYGVLGAARDGQPLFLAIVASDAACGPKGTVLSVDPATGAVRTAWTGEAADPAGATLGLALQFSGVVGYSAPDGWALLAPDGQLARTPQAGALAPMLVSLSDGATVPVPFVPSFTRSW